MGISDTVTCQTKPEWSEGVYLGQQHSRRGRLLGECVYVYAACYKKACVVVGKGKGISVSTEKHKLDRKWDQRDGGYVEGWSRGEVYVGLIYYG